MDFHNDTACGHGFVCEHQFIVHRICFVALTSRHCNEKFYSLSFGSDFALCGVCGGPRLIFHLASFWAPALHPKSTGRRVVVSSLRFLFYEGA